MFKRLHFVLESARKFSFWPMQRFRLSLLCIDDSGDDELQALSRLPHLETLELIGWDNIEAQPVITVLFFRRETPSVSHTRWGCRDNQQVHVQLALSDSRQKEHFAPER